MHTVQHIRVARHSSSGRPSSGYAPNIHDGYPRLNRRSTMNEKFNIDPPIVYQQDLFKPKLLTNLIREEKIKDINVRLNVPTFATRVLVPFYTQEELLNRVDQCTKSVLLDKNGGIRKGRSWGNGQGTFQYNGVSASNGKMTPAPRCPRPVYYELWTYPTKDSYEFQWMHHKRHFTSNFRHGNSKLAKSYSLYRSNRQ